MGTLVGRGAEPPGERGAGRSVSGPPLDRLAATVRSMTGLDLLIVFGSRARGDARPDGDWDIGYPADETADVPGAKLADHIS